MQHTLSALATSVALTLLISACGGGGGGGGGGDNPGEPDPPVIPTPTPTPTENFQLTGTITASQSQAVDSDTNDPTRIAVANDHPSSPQVLANPVTLGGYVNQPDTGAEGRSQILGDPDDYFLVDLLAGQQITMLIADFESADADLYLYDTLGNILDLSIDTGDLEVLTVSKAGTYIVNVFAFDGATNYILAIGAPGTSALPTSQPDIVPFEMVVEFKDTLLDTSANSAIDSTATSMGMQQLAGGPGRNRLMALRNNVQSKQIKARLGKAAGKLDQIGNAALRDRWETLMAIKTLRKDPRVQYAEPNYRVRAFATPNDEAYPIQYHYPLIGLPEAWDISTGSPDVIVAVVDTGILSNHPDLAGQLVGGYDFVRDSINAGDGNSIDPNPEDPGDSSSTSTGGFHGTHVLGTIAARGNNQIGVVGAAFTAKAMPLRALGIDGGGTSYDVNQAIRYAAGLPNDSGSVPAKPADIINLSLGGGFFSPAEQNLFDQVRTAGVMVVAAAGNEATTAPSYPAAYDNVISVSAVDGQRRITSYSNTGAQVDVAAPGGDSSADLNGDGYPDGVLSTIGSMNGGDINFAYRFLDGTSMASPHVAGVLALMKSVNPDLTPDDIDALLVSGALTDDLGPPGRDNTYGNGLINAQLGIFAALEAAGNSPADNPRLVSSASTLNFGGTGTSLELLLRNGGKGDLTLNSVTSSEPWLQFQPLDVDESGLGSYNIMVDRSGLSAGVYDGTITAESSVNIILLRALISVGGAGSGSDVGVIYILLYDPATDEPVTQFVSAGESSVYPFQFFDIPAGEYEIIAGSDADNDLFICDAGEACGAFLTIDQPIFIQVEDDMEGLDFPVEYQVLLPQISGQQTGSAGQSSGNSNGNGNDKTRRGIKRMSIPEGAVPEDEAR
jgi:serine protease